MKKKKNNSPVISLEEIKALAVPSSVLRGNFLYFLLQAGKVVYVGKSEFSPHLRIVDHARTKEFDGMAIFPIPADLNILEVESENIVAHNPIYNQTLSSSEKYVSETETHKRTKKTPRRLAKLGIFPVFKGWYLRKDVTPLFLEALA